MTAPNPLRQEELDAIQHVACPEPTGLAAGTVPCVGRPEYDGGPNAHRPRVGAYRDWLAQQGG